MLPSGYKAYSSLSRIIGGLYHADIRTITLGVFLGGEEMGGRQGGGNGEEEDG